MYYEIFGSLYFVGITFQMFFLLTTEPETRLDVTFISCGSRSVEQKSIKKYLQVIKI